MLEDIFDEFASDQSLPLDYHSPLASSSTSSMFSASSHYTSSHYSAHTTPSHHTSASSSRGGNVPVLQLTQSENEQLARFMRRMQQVTARPAIIIQSVNDSVFYRLFLISIIDEGL